MSMHEKEKWGEKEPGCIGLGSVVTRWPPRVSERASEEGAWSRKSFVHSDPYRKVKTEPIQLVLLFAPLFDLSSSLRSRWVRPFCSLFESQATKSAKKKSSEQRKRAEGTRSRHVSGEQYTACRGKTGISGRLQRKKKEKSIDSKSV